MTERCRRIALVAHSMRCGGLDTVLLRLGRYLTGAGFEVEILTTCERGEWFGKIGEWGLGGDHVEVVNRRVPCSPLIHSLRIKRKLIQKDFDVVFLNHAIYAQAAILMLPDSVVAIPILHNDVDYVYRVGCANYQAVNALVGVSPRVCETAQFLVGATPVVEILNGVDMPAQEAWKRRPGLSGANLPGVRRQDRAAAEERHARARNPQIMPGYLAAGKPVLALSPAVGVVADLSRGRGIVRVDIEGKNSVEAAIYDFYQAFRFGRLDEMSPTDELKRALLPDSVGRLFQSKVHEILETSPGPIT